MNGIIQYHDYTRPPFPDPRARVIWQNHSVKMVSRSFTRRNSRCVKNESEVSQIKRDHVNIRRDVRRNRWKLQLFYNIVNKNTPNYLCTLISSTIQSTSVYPLRNGNDIILHYCRLSSTSDSFIPFTINMWNS